MNEIDTSSLALQMRALIARMNEAAPQPAGGADKLEFSGVFKQALDQVNSTQQHAAELADRFERGDSGVNVAEVMIALQMADVSFQAVSQVRNRLISAYQEIMNMPI